MSTDTKETYCVSEDGGESYNGKYPSKEAAIAAYKASHREPYGTIYIGRCVTPPQPEDIWDADDWLDRVCCQDDYSLDCAENWCRDIMKGYREQKKELETAVRKVMAEWLDRHNLRPDFFLIEDAEEVKMEDAQ